MGLCKLRIAAQCETGLCTGVTVDGCTGLGHGRDVLPPLFQAPKVRAADQRAEVCGAKGQHVVTGAVQVQVGVVNAERDARHVQVHHEVDERLLLANVAIFSLGSSELGGIPKLVRARTRHARAREQPADIQARQLLAQLVTATVGAHHAVCG